MKIALVDWRCSRPGQDGIVTDIVWSLASRLAAGGDDVHVVGPYAQADAPAPGVQVHSFRILPPGYRSIVGLLLQSASAWATLRAIRGVQIVHAADYFNSGLILGLGARWPVVLTTPCNADERLVNVHSFGLMWAPVFKLFTRLSARRCARIIATSRAMEEWWARSGAAPERIVRLPLGVELEQFRPSPRETARARLGWGPEPRALFVGRLAEENGASYLLRAMADVTQRLPQAHLEMVGTGKEQPSLRTLTRELGLAERVRWHGHVPLARLPLFYNAADVFVFPRLSRATPRVMLQALACALPVITSALGALEDFVVDGETGFLVPPRDPARLAERIEALLRDRVVAERFGRAARAFACRELDWDQLVPRIRENVYQPVLAGH